MDRDVCVCVFHAKVNLKEVRAAWISVPLGLVEEANSLEGGVCGSHGSGG